MVIVTTAVYWGLSSPLRIHSQFPLTFQHRAGVSPYTSSYDFARTCVFGKQSFPSILCDPTTLQPHRSSRHRAPLLPKLRGHFAEFLNHSSPERLSIFNLTTCVGLGYGPYTHSLEAFLDSKGSPPSTPMGLRITPQPQSVADLPTTRPTRLHHQSTKWRGYLTASPHHLNHTSGPTTSTPPTLKEC